jgi:hypothetical protein
MTGKSRQLDLDMMRAPVGYVLAILLLLSLGIAIATTT